MMGSVVSSLWFKDANGIRFQTNPEHFKAIPIGTEPTTIIFLLSTFKEFIEWVPVTDEDGNLMYDEETGEELIKSVPYICKGRGTLKLEMFIDRKIGRVNSKVINQPEGYEFMAYDLESHMLNTRYR